MKAPLDDMIRVFRQELFVRRNAVALIFMAISLSILLIGVAWPKIYRATSVVLVEAKKIIQPLTEGVAVPTEIMDFAKIARELVYGRKIMTAVLQEDGWLEHNPSPVERDNLIGQLERQTEVYALGSSLTNLIEIEYKDGDPVRAAKIANRLAELLVAETTEQKTKESKTAFAFFDKQVQEYHDKLLRSETNLKEFRSETIDGRSGTETEVTARVSDLQARLQQTKLELAEALSKKESLDKQLVGEAEIGVSATREEQYHKRLAKLQAKLDKLQLNYHDIHPQVIKTKHQMEDLARAIAGETQQREPAKASGSEEKRPSATRGVYINPLYGQLRSEISGITTAIHALRIRAAEIEELLNQQFERGKRVLMGQAKLVELTRDYEVNRDVYQELLKRRETARLSMNLDQEGQGLNMRVHEGAVVPVRPHGLAFIYFPLSGLVLGILVPLGLIFALVNYDPRVRFISVITEKLNLPLLAVIPHLSRPTEVRRVAWKVTLLGLIVLFYLGMFAYISWLKFTGVLTFELDVLKFVPSI